jgi:hypothetical protein
MITLTMSGVIVDPQGKPCTVLGAETIFGRRMLNVKGPSEDFWATPAELYRRGYRLVAAKPAIWDIWGYYGPTLRQQSPAGQGVLQ